MRAINHALTGAVIGLTIHQPAVALPVALASHLVLDVIPHEGRDWKANISLFNKLLVADGLLCFLLVVWLFAARPDSWLLPAACAFLAAAPDLLKIPEWLAGLRHKPFKRDSLGRFLSYIQWSETPRGTIIEVVWFVIFATIVYRYSLRI